ncbi:ATP-dependent DNA helicase RecG [Pontibacter arcticus]|uniref:ATP-dependent DNA helicase RecG n=1 Tax=Pontibacter arcticus TaxID=2080288 RepID=A0A364RAV5_9BACT|nr:ATP-dependent DNA helicase RecG [Pontibacter arcticus]RAU81490.1 ATP-dependent DNA helicase RecG [Pontibacter arcticus]
MTNFFNTKLEFLKGVGPMRAELLQKEMGMFTYGDLIQHYPFRYLDRTQFYKVAELDESMPYVQVRGRVRGKQILGEGRKQRLSAILVDEAGDELELVWFKGVKWMEKSLKNHTDYIVFGKPTAFNGKYNMAHPELEDLTEEKQTTAFLQPVYNTTEKLKAHRIDSKVISRMMEMLLKVALPQIQETLSQDLIDQYRLMDKRSAMANIHFPESAEKYTAAKFRLKFEELFYIQLRLFRQKLVRKSDLEGQIFRNTATLTDFYKNHLTFDLTGAQKRVIKEIYKDLTTGKQMNRLLQGDVGSGKTIVAFITMLIAADNGAQSVLMAPTEILAGQHYIGLKQFADSLGINIGKLTGSTKAKDRKILHEQLRSGEMKMIVGTHALLEDVVQFHNLGLCIVDEQHRFGVEQRSKLWRKNPRIIPHVLVMTATPIPRTLAMTLYGDLDVSVIDEMPAGRKDIITVHRFDSHRLRVFQFIRDEIKLGRQVYIVYPLIEESEQMENYKDLMDGFESVQRAFPEYKVSMVHGKMKPQDKDYEMQRFVKHETHIMVATTVIEVGVNVPNASVMVIESAERFGLSQLHQLRGRVGRGAEQSYCILMTGYKIGKDTKVRIETMVRTNNGFEIADIDLKLRGPGDLMGTQQSGVLDLLIADLSKDAPILQEARAASQRVLKEDPMLEQAQNQNIRRHIQSLSTASRNWSRIS